MAPGTLARLAIVLAAVAAGLESIAVAGRASGDAWLSMASLATVVAGWTAALCGVVVLSRRRAVGVLLTLTGLAWLARNWNQPGADGAVAFTAGLLVATVYPVLLAHTGLRSARARLVPAERAALALGYFCALFVAGLPPALVFDPVSRSCYDCPANLAGVTSSTTVFDAMTRAGVLAGVVWPLLLAIAIGTRLSEAARARRVEAAVVCLPTLVLLGAVWLDYVHSAGRGFLSDDLVDRRLVVIQAAALTAAALGTLWPELQRRLVRRRVTNLVIEVAGAPQAGRLAESLGAAVGDPSLRVLYPLADGRITDATGARAHAGRDRVTTPLVRGGQVIALVAHREGLLEAAETPGEIARSAALVLHNERLQAEARSRLADVRASRARIVELADAERRRLERDLHDGAQQKLVALSLSLRVAALRAGGTDPDLEAALTEVTAALGDLRRLARGIFPRELADEGLAAALQTFTEDAPERIEMISVPQARFDPRVESAAFFTVTFLTRAGLSAASVAVTRDGKRIRVEVLAADPPADLTSLEDRVRAVDGTISRRDGAVQVELPCAS